jgi:AraC-like DNA-binding protein
MPEPCHAHVVENGIPLIYTYTKAAPSVVPYFPAKYFHHRPPLMPPLPPVYKAHGKAFKADTCRPVAEAVEQGKIQYKALVRGHYPGSQLPRGALGGVRNVGFWSIDAPQPWGLAWHRNEGIELTFLESGQLDFAADDRRYHLRAGDLTFTRPWQRHCVGNPNVTPSRLHWLILDLGVRRPHQPWRWPSWLVLTPDDREELTTKLRQAVDAVWHAHGDVVTCFQRIGAAVAADRDGDNASRLAAYLNELFVLLLDLLRQGQVSFDQTLASAQQTVDLFWKDMRRNTEFLATDWAVREMAHQCGLGVTQFTRHCRQLTNMTPMEYLARCRIVAATELLKVEPDRSVTDVGLSLGFSSSQYFAKVFRKHTGCTPSEYRRRYGC